MRGGTAVIVLSWNGEADTLACLASLSRVRSPEFVTLLVDNASSDRTTSMVRRAFPQVEILELPRNIGFAAGNNAGFGALRGRDFETVVFLNNDTIVDPEFLQPLMDALKEPWVGIATPKILYMEDPSRLWYAGGEVNRATGRISHRGIRRPDSLHFSTPCPVGYATGCCLAMRSRDFEAFGGFDERFRMYGEDVDLSMKVRERGLVISYQPASRLWHRVSASSGGEMSVARQLRKSAAALKVFGSHGLWSALLLYPLLWPLRTLLDLVRYRLFLRAEAGSGGAR